MQTVLITGANGFVGHYTAQRLVAKEYRVIATGKGECRLAVPHPNFVYETLDFTNEEAVKAVFEKHKPQCVVHTGALSKPDECEQNKEAAFRTNVTGTLYLLNTAARYQSFFVFLSTDFIFSGREGMYKEDDVPAPVNYYGETKLLAEGEVKKYPFAWSIVRTVLVYGNPKGGRHNILTNAAESLKRGEQLRIFNDQVRTPTYVEDLAKAIVTIVEKKAEGVYHVSGKDVLTPYDMTVAVARHLGLNEKLISGVTEETFQQPARRPLKTGFDISKAKRDLGYEPVSFAEGLKKTFA